MRPPCACRKHGGHHFPKTTSNKPSLQSAILLEQQTYDPETPDGWRLDITRFRNPDTFDSTYSPVVMFPGYAMNDFVLSFHPTGPSLVESLAGTGFEVWTANLRTQGDSYYDGTPDSYGLRELCLLDIPTVFKLIEHASNTERLGLHTIGCSLGATFLYGYLAHHRDNHPIRSLVSIGGPLEWNDVHPILSFLFSSPFLAGLVPIRGVQPLAKLLMPLLKAKPELISMYMNLEQIDIEPVDELVNTMENPNPYLNRQLALWIKHRRLEIAGVDVTEALHEVDLPLLCVVANRDGLVPPKSAISIVEALGSSDISVMHVGNPDEWHAHADLFVADGIQEKFFEPMSEWLIEIEQQQ